VQETVEKEIVKTVWKPVETTKTVSRKVGQWVVENYTIPATTRTQWVRTPSESVFDPATCRTVCKPGKLTRVCCEVPAKECCRKVFKINTVCEQVTCKSYVRECVREKVPVTVCKKVPVCTVKKVPYTVCKVVPETIIKKVPYTVTRMVPETVVKKVPYTVSRTVRGAYVDGKGVGHGEPGFDKGGDGKNGNGKNGDAKNGNDGKGSNGNAGGDAGKPWTFTEGATFDKTYTTTSTRMVRETQVKKVPYTVYKTVTEEAVKKVPYTVVKMVPETVKKMVPVTVTEMETTKCVKKVPYKVCRTETVTVCKRVPETICKMVPYTVNVKVPYKVTECVPVTVCKRVKVDPCDNGKCGNNDCDPCKEKLLDKIFRNRLCCKNPCEDSCAPAKVEAKPAK